MSLISKENEGFGSMSEPWVSTRVNGDIGVVLLNRPEKLNALTSSMIIDVSSAIRAFSDAGVAGILLTGVGKAFSSGDDLNEALSLSRESFAALIEAFQDATRSVHESRVPVIAGVNGIAVGGGAELALACDMRIGCSGTEFLFPENGLGLTISNGSSLILRDIAGGRAIGLILSGRRVSAADAAAFGLLDELMERSDDIERAAIRAASQFGQHRAITSLHLRLLRPDREELEEALRREFDIAMEAWDSGAWKDGIERWKSRMRA